MEKFILKNGEINAIKYDGSEESKNEIKNASYGYYCNGIKDSPNYGNICLLTHRLDNYLLKKGDYCVVNKSGQIIYSVEGKYFEKTIKENS